MKRKVWLLALVVILLLAAAPAALAQDGDEGKVLFGQRFTLRSGERLDGDLTGFNSIIVLEQDSTVQGDVAVFGGSISVAGRVSGNVVSMGGSVTLGDTAIVGGDVVAFGGSIEQAPGATILGQVLTGFRVWQREDRVIPAPQMEVRPPAQRFWGLIERLLLWQLQTLGSGVLMILIGLAVLLIAPKGVGRVASAAATQPAVSFGLGLLTLLLGVFAGALLLIACGLGLLVWLALVVGLILGWIGVGLWIGEWLLGMLNLRPTSSVPALAVGIFVITVLANLPFCIGFLFWLILGSIGLGAVVATRFGTESVNGEPARPVALTPSEAESDLTL